jgi:hypothetical protein
MCATYTPGNPQTGQRQPSTPLPTTGPCPGRLSDEVKTTSSATNQRVGQVLGKQTATNEFTMVWTFDTAAAVVVADGADGPSLYQWWQSNAHLIVSS